MAKRSGVGATVAAAVIFSILLASNFSVYYASQEDARLHATANAEDTLADEAAASEGAEATDILLKEQVFLESNLFSCGTAPAAVSTEIGSLSDIQVSQNLSVVTTASPTLSQGPAIDSISMLGSFGGYVTGYLDTTMHEVAKGSESALGVSYARNETHYANLPVRVADMAEVCEQAFSDIEGVHSAPLPNCTVSNVAPLIAKVAMGPSTMAKDSGFRFAVASTIVGAAPCSVELTVTVSQANVMGPAGAFSVELQREGLVVFESAQPQPE